MCVRRIRLTLTHFYTIIDRQMRASLTTFHKCEPHFVRRTAGVFVITTFSIDHVDKNRREIVNDHRPVGGIRQISMNGWNVRNLTQ
jgi:hypothetical protein